MYPSYPAHTKLLHNPAGCRVPHEMPRQDSPQPQAAEAMAFDSLTCFSSKAVPPIRLTDPLAEFARTVRMRCNLPQGRYAFPRDILHKFPACRGTAA